MPLSATGDVVDEETSGAATATPEFDNTKSLDAHCPAKKRRTVCVRTKRKPPPKRRFLVARKVKPGEDISLEALERVWSPEKLRGVRRSADGKILERSILGPTEHFEQLFTGSFEAHESMESVQMGATGEQLSTPKFTATRKCDVGRSDQTRHTPSGGLFVGTTVRQPVKGGTFDPVQDDKRYFGALEAMRRRALDEMETTLLDEERLIQSMSLHDSLHMNREGRVLHKWMEQQRDWQRLSQGLSRVTAKRPEELVMMSSADEWRQQTEVYEVMQSAIPQYVRHAEHYWEMSLRNHGQRIVHVGNIFSGLSCPINRKSKLPTQIRKPLSSSDTVRHSERPQEQPQDKKHKKSWRTEPYLLARQRQWTAKLKQARKLPHEVSSFEANSLAAMGRDLFEWAAESSAAFIKELAEEQRRANDEDKKAAAVVAQAEVQQRLDAEAAAEAATAAADSLRRRAVLAVLSQREMTIYSRAGDSTPSIASLRLENRGSTVVYYEWRRKSRNVSEYDDDLPTDVGVTRARSRDVLFFCINPRGSLAPGRGADVVFGFKSAVPGQFSDDWKLAVAPAALLVPDDGDAVNLRGIAAPRANATHLRVAFESDLDKRLARSAVAGLLRDEVVAHVSTPTAVRRRRKEEAFTQAFKMKTRGRRIEYSQQRCEAFAALWTGVRDLVLSDFLNQADCDDPTVTVRVAPEALDLARRSVEWDGDLHCAPRVLDAIDFIWNKPCPPPAPAEDLTTGDDSDEQDEEDEQESTEEAAHPAVEVNDPRWNDRRAVCVRTHRSRWRELVSLSSIRDLKQSPILAANWTEATARALVAAQESAGLTVRPSPIDLHDDAWQRSIEATIPEGAPDDSPAALAAACVAAHGNSGDQAYRSGAVAAIKRLIVDSTETSSTESHPDDSLARIAVARPTDLHGKIVLFQSDLNLPLYLTEKSTWTLDESVARPASERVEAAARSLLALLPPLEDTTKKKKVHDDLHEAETIRAQCRPRAVVLLTDLTPPSDEDFEEAPSTKILIEALRESSARFRYAVEFVGSVTALEKEYLLSNTLESHNATSLVPLLVLEARNDWRRLCPPSTEALCIADASTVAMPRTLWSESEALAARSAIEAAVEASDAGARLRGLVEVIVQDDPAALDDEIRGLQRLSAPRFVGIGVKDQLNVARALLATRPLVVVLGDVFRRGDFLDEKNGLASRAHELDAWLEAADSVLVAGRLAIELLAAAGHSVGKHTVDPALFPAASKLLAKAVRLDVNLHLPTDFATGDLLVDQDGVVGAGAIQIDEEELTEDDYDDEDAADGFDYDGDVADTSISEGGIPDHVYALDVGPATCKTYTRAVATANAVFWAGLLGAAECSPFQTSTRAMVDTCVTVREDRACLLVLACESTCTWFKRFSTLDSLDEAVHHIGDKPLINLLAANTLPGLSQFEQRDPDPRELILQATRRAEQALEDEEEDEDGDDEEDEDD